MSKFLVLLFSLMLGVGRSFCADMSFAQIEGAMISAHNTTSTNRLQNIIEKINNQKNIDFVVFTGNNIAKPSKTNLEKFIQIANEF